MILDHAQFRLRFIRGVLSETKIRLLILAADLWLNFMMERRIVAAAHLNPGKQKVAS
jgi:hypothetical protein